MMLKGLCHHGLDDDDDEEKKNVNGKSFCSLYCFLLSRINLTYFYAFFHSNQLEKV